MKVDLHEGCGRIKLYWTMALTDYRTLKGLVEFKEAGGSKKSYVFYSLLPLVHSSYFHTFGFNTSCLSPKVVARAAVDSVVQQVTQDSCLSGMCVLILSARREQTWCVTRPSPVGTPVMV